MRHPRMFVVPLTLALLLAAPPSAAAASSWTAGGWTAVSPQDGQAR